MQISRLLLPVICIFFQLKVSASGICNVELKNSRISSTKFGFSIAKLHPILKKGTKIQRCTALARTLSVLEILILASEEFELCLALQSGYPQPRDSIDHYKETYRGLSEASGAYCAK